MSKPLRIAVFLGTFPVVSETFILRQIVGLLDLGHQVDIYADTQATDNAPLQPEILSYKLLNRTTYVRAPSSSVPWEMPIYPITGETWLPGAEKPIRNFSRLAEALPVFFKTAVHSPQLARRSLMRRHYGYPADSLSTLYRIATLSRIPRQYDILHAHFGPVGNSFRFVRQLFQSPFIVSFHGYDFSTVPQKSGPDVYRHLFTEVDAVTVNSDFMGKGLKELGCPESKIRKILYGINLEAFSRTASPPSANSPVRVVTIGRLVEKKGIEDSIRAFARVRASHSNIHYDIIGEGPLRTRLENVISELKLETCVFLHGAQEANAVRKLLSTAHIFMLASKTAPNGDKEGTPVSLLEAQALGLPVLSTYHSGIPEIVRDEKSGFLVPEGDIEKLADRLGYLIDHPDARDELGANGRNFVAQHFSAQIVTRRIVDLYQSVKFSLPS